MTKRIIASVLGVLALIAGLIAILYAIDGLQDFRNPDVSIGFTTVGEVFMFGLSLAALILCIRFLLFAFRGRSNKPNSLLSAMLLGIGFFFPGFLLSLPFVFLVTFHFWPKDGRADFVSMLASLCAGSASAIVCCIFTVKKTKSPSNFLTY